MLGDDVPADAVVDAVLQQHGPVDRVGLIQGDVTAVCLRHAADLQHKHDLAARGKKRRRGTVRGGKAYLDIFNEYMCCMADSVRHERHDRKEDGCGWI